MLIEQESEFWQRVIDRNPPAPTTNKDANQFHRKVNGKYVVADHSIVQYVLALKEARFNIKTFEDIKEGIEVEIKNFMGENETLVDADGIPLVTWKQKKGSKRIDSEALRDNYPEIAAAVTLIGDPIRQLLVK